MATQAQRIDREQQGVALDQGRLQAQARPGKRRKGSWSRLTRTERNDLLTGLERVFDGLYAHLPLKRARYGFDPVQRLRILRTQADRLSADAFHFELTSILSGMRDFHTMYQRPVVGKKRVAALPFRVEAHFRHGRPSYIVSNVGRALWDEPDFKPGVLLVDWNGVPMDRAVRRHAEREYGGRPDSALAAALDSLTLRPIAYYDLPDEDWVLIGYRRTKSTGRPFGPRHELKLKWGLIDPSVGRTTEYSGARRKEALVVARNPVATEMKRAKRLLFAPYTLKGQSRLPDGARRGKGAQLREIPSRKPQVLRAAVLDGPDGPYGYLRLYEFDVAYPKSYVDELIRLVELLPQRGLVIDVRDNPGGNILAAERALQLFTPRTIEPARFSMLATPLTRYLCTTPWLRDELRPWRESLEAAVRNGELYSAAVPITPRSDCNDIGQRYSGPVVLIASATTYSSGDLFSAGFVDNRIGPFVCVGDSTGAGGANVWEYAWFRAVLRGSAFELPKLPDGAGMTVSFRRATRIGGALGTPIEDVGVPGGRRYQMTYRDLTCANKNMLAYCIDILRRLPVSRLDARLGPSGTRLSVTSEGLDRLEVRFDGRSADSIPLRSNAAQQIAVPARTGTIEVFGYQRNVLRQRRLLRVERSA